MLSRDYFEVAKEDSVPFYSQLMPSAHKGIGKLSEIQTQLEVTPEGKRLQVTQMCASLH